MSKSPIAVTHPEIAAQLKDQSLAEVLTHGSNKEVAWVCDLAHEYETRVDKRTGRGHGCSYCSGKRVLAGFNDLGTLRPDVACELKDPSLALTITVSSIKRLRWVCRGCTNEWEARVDHRTSGQGCPACAKHGFDQTAPAWVYLVSQPSLHDEDTTIVKLGVTNLDRLEARLNEHARQGLTEVLALSAYPSGSDALSRETSFKRYLKDLPPKYRVTRDELPDGYTEAFLSTAPDWEAHALI